MTICCVRSLCKIYVIAYSDSDVPYMYSIPFVMERYDVARLDRTLPTRRNSLQ